MNALEFRQHQLQELLGSDEPEHKERYIQLHQEMTEFNKKVDKVLSENFREDNYRSTIAILNSIPTGDLDFIFSSWLDELANLWLITPDRAAEYRK